MTKQTDTAPERIWIVPATPSTKMGEFYFTAGYAGSNAIEYVREDTRTRSIETTEASELLPCPFCGETGQLHEDDAVNVFHATCGNDECLMFPGVYAEESAAEAIRKWNTRTRSPLADDEKAAAFIVSNCGAQLGESPDILTFNRALLEAEIVTALHTHSAALTAKVEITEPLVTAWKKIMYQHWWGGQMRYVRSYKGEFLLLTYAETKALAKLLEKLQPQINAFRDEARAAKENQ